jgi:hypothetical protein
LEGQNYNNSGDKSLRFSLPFGYFNGKGNAGLQISVKSYENHEKYISIPLKMSKLAIELNDNVMSLELNKPLAGYHMLMILSAVDGRFSGNEDSVILEYLAEEKLLGGNVDEHLDYLSNLKREDYSLHFSEAMNAFYMNSTAEERTHFLDKAVRLVMADQLLTPRENLFIDELFNTWEANYA